MEEVLNIMKKVIYNVSLKGFHYNILLKNRFFTYQRKCIPLTVNENKHCILKLVNDILKKKNDDNTNCVLITLMIFEFSYKYELFLFMCLTPKVWDVVLNEHNYLFIH